MLCVIRVGDSGEFTCDVTVVFVLAVCRRWQSTVHVTVCGRDRQSKTRPITADRETDKSIELNVTEAKLPTDHRPHRFLGSSEV